MAAKKKMGIWLPGRSCGMCSARFTLCEQVSSSEPPWGRVKTRDCHHDLTSTSCVPRLVSSPQCLTNGHNDSRIPLLSSVLRHACDSCHDQKLSCQRDKDAARAAGGHARARESGTSSTDGTIRSTPTCPSHPSPSCLFAT